MFCSVFMDKEDWVILTAIAKDNKVLLIDTREHSPMESDEGSESQVKVAESLSLRSVNNMVWESGMPNLSLYAFPHDTIMLGDTIKIVLL